MTAIERIERMIAHYEAMSVLFQPGDIRGPMMAQAAKDFREALDGDKFPYVLTPPSEKPPT